MATRFPRLVPFLALVLINAVTTNLAQAGKLDRAGSVARGASSSSSSHSSSSHSSHGSSHSSSSSSSSTSRSTSSMSETYNDNNGDVDAATFFANALYYAVLGVTVPWWRPYQVLEETEPKGTAKSMRFADYPYAQGARGHLLRSQRIVYGLDGVARSTSGDTVVPRLLQSYSLRLGLETGIGLFDGISRLGFSARLQLPLRLQFDADWSRYRERDPEGVDVAWLGREHVAIRFAESSRLQFYTGFGAQHFCDTLGCVHGVDATWGFEAFPGKPITLGLEGSIGNLEHAFAPGLRTRFGFLVGPVEVSVGYHQRWVGKVPLGGPFIGLGGWF